MSEIALLNEELFCVRYELKVFADIILEGKAERWLPNFTGSTKDFDHLGRYELVCAYVNGTNVLDIACGAGKGSKLMATKGKAKRVTGGDIDAEAVRYARHRYADPAVSFQEIDGLKMNFKNEFDVVVSFETIEHISAFPVFLENVREALREGGTFIVSTPISAQHFDAHPLNPYHTQEWGFSAFHDVLTEAKFRIEKIYTQLDLDLGTPSISQRVWKRLTAKKKNIKHYTGYSEKKIEHFNGQYDPADFGKTRNGFQIVVCKKASD